MTMKNVMLVLVLVSAAFLLGTCNAGDSWEKKYETYRQESIAAATALKDSSNILTMNLKEALSKYRTDTTELRVELRKQRATSAKLRASNIALNHSLQEQLDGVDVEELPPVCQTCLNLVSGLTRENESLDQQNVNLLRLDAASTRTVVTLRDAYSFERLRGDSLTRVIFEMPKPKVNKLFGLFKLTPTQGFFLGVAVVGTANLLVNPKDD